MLEGLGASPTELWQLGEVAHLGAKMLDCISAREELVASVVVVVEVSSSPSPAQAVKARAIARDRAASMATATYGCAIRGSKQGVRRSACL